MISLKVQDGAVLPPSAQDVARPLTAIDRLLPQDMPVDKETVLILTAFTACLMRNVMSQDVVWLTIRSSVSMLTEAGVSEDKCNAVMQKILDCWKRESDKNPLKSMF